MFSVLKCGFGCNGIVSPLTAYCAPFFPICFCFCFCFSAPSSCLSLLLLLSFVSPWIYNSSAFGSLQIFICIICNQAPDALVKTTTLLTQLKKMRSPRFRDSLIMCHRSRQKVCPKSAYMMLKQSGRLRVHLTSQGYLWTSALWSFLPLGKRSDSTPTSVLWVE